MYICTQYACSTYMYLCSLTLSMLAPEYFYVHSLTLPSPYLSPLYHLTEAIPHLYHLTETLQGGQQV